MVKVQSNSDQVVRRTVFKIMEKIDMRSPVGNPSLWKDWNKGGVAANPEHWLVKAGFVGEGYVGGHFRANWQLGVNVQSTGEIKGHDYKGKLEQEQAKIPAKAAGPVYYYQNNVPYAQAIEDGHSQGQAPHGVVGLVVVEFGGIVSEAVTGVNK